MARSSQRLVALKDSRGRKFDPGDLVAPQAVKPIGWLPLISALLGAFVGCVGVLFFFLSKSLALVVLNGLGGMDAMHGTHAEEGIAGWLGNIMHSLGSDAQGSATRLWVLGAAPIIGGILVGLWRWKCKDTGAVGMGLAIDSFHNRRGHLSIKLVWQRFVGAILTLGSGGSGGREGPISLMGAAMGSWAAERLHLTVRERRVLLAAGIAAGVGGMFRAPLAGGLLAAEIFYSDSEFEPDVLVPSMLASVSSYCVFCLCFGWDPLFAVVASTYTFHNPAELLPLLLLSLSLVISGFVFVGAGRLGTRLFERVAFPWKPMLGALLTSLTFIAIYLSFGERPELQGLLSDGYGVLQLLFAGEGPWIVEGAWWVLLVIAGGKLLTSIFTNVSGGVAGLFAPSMVIGGSIGGALGLLFLNIMPSQMMPEVATDGEVVGIFALVGMAGFYAATARAPVSTIIIVSELTGSYHLLLPALWVVTLCFLLGSKLKTYRHQVPSRMDSAAHRGDFHVDVLKEITVKDILKELQNFETIEQNVPVREILKIRTTRQAYFPVVTKEGRFSGIFSMNDLRAVLYDQEVWELLVAEDIAHHNVVTVHPRETLAEVSQKFGEEQFDELPVVADDDEKTLLGIISRRQLNNAYIRRMMIYDQANRLERTRIMEGEEED